jgi:two-component system, NarL family, sensor histidine kinase UhpB
MNLSHAKSAPMTSATHLFARQSASLVPARFRLPAIVACILIPAMVIAGWLSNRSAASERAQIEKNVEQKVREIAIQIDRELAVARGVLSALASSQFLQTQDFEAFYRQASQISRELNMSIVLRDATTDEQIIHTARPWGSPPVRGGPPVILDDVSLASGQYIVSNVFFGRALEQFAVGVRLPIRHNSGAVHFLGATIPAARFARILAEADLPAQRIATIIDRNNVIVARSQRHDDFVGKTLLSDLRARASGPAGTDAGENRDGIVYRWSWRRLEGADWVVSVGLPESVLAAPSRLALLAYGGASTLLLAMAVGLAYGLGSRLSIGALGIDRNPTRDEFRVLFESAPNGVVVIDHRDCIVLLNAQLERMFGYGREELRGKSIETLMPERFRSGHSRHRSEYARNPSARSMGIGRDLFGQRKDGTEFPVEIGLNPIRTHNSNLVIATIADITQRRLATDRLNATLRERDELRRRFMQAQEEERLRLARELHDQTGQSLTAVMLELKSMEGSMTEADRNRLRRLRQDLEHMGRTLHQVAWELRPASIDELGLSSALANYVAEWTEQYGIETDFHCATPAIDELPTEIKTTLYRVLQEALTNVVKHARGATCVSIILERNGRLAQMTVEDDGSGFEISPLGGDGKGLGLAGMRERLALVGGELEIDSSTGRGTTVFARIHLNKE